MTNLTLPLVVDAVAKASVILAVSAAIAASLRRASASARHFVWTLGLLSALAAPALSLALPRWELPIVTFAAPAPVISSAPSPIAQSPDVPIARSMTPPALGNARLEGVEGPVRRLPSWPVVAFLIWAAGASVILARLLLGLVAVQWMSRRTPEVTVAPWLPQAHALAQSLGMSNVRFLRGRAGTMPMAWGILRSSVLVPADADTWPAHRVRVVLLHELAHVKRRDCLTHLVAQLAVAAYWFNPLAWMAARKLRTERERACDDLVLAAGTRGSDYADQLLDIARVMQAGRFPAVLAGASLAMAQRSQLEGRLMAILDPNVPRRGLTRARAAAAAAVFTIVIVALASVQPWAEERAAVNAATTDQAIEQRPIEQYPGQAAKDNRANAAKQGPLQDAVQGVVQGQLQGQLQGQIQGAVQGAVQRGVSTGVAAGVGIASAVTSAVIDGVTGGIAGGIAGGVAGGVAGGIAGGVRHDVDDRDDDKNQDKETRVNGRDPRAVNALLEALKDTDKGVREMAMQALVRMRDPRMFDPLVAALKDSSADIREQAAHGLGQLRDQRAIEPLAGALKDSNASVREQVVFALGQLRAVAAIDAIAIALRDSSPSVREQAAFALSQIRDKRAMEPLISALKDEKANVRHQAAFALGQLRAAGAVEALVIALKDTDASVREQAAFALGQIRDPRAIDGLMIALKDANASVRQQAAFALGQIR